MLLFTQDGYKTKALRHHWTDGWSHGRLVQYDDINYVCKYINKTDDRPRSSNGLTTSFWKQIDENPLIQGAGYIWPGAKIKMVTLLFDQYDSEYNYQQIRQRIWQEECGSLIL